jgi:hypothetical protein
MGMGITLSTILVFTQEIQKPKKHPKKHLDLGVFMGKTSFAGLGPLVGGGQEGKVGRSVGDLTGARRGHGGGLQVT